MKALFWYLASRALGTRSQDPGSTLQTYVEPGCIVQGDSQRVERPN